MKYIHLILYIFLFNSCKDVNTKINQSISDSFIRKDTILLIDSLVNKNTKEIDFKNLSVLSFSDIKGIKEIKDKNIVDKINRSCIHDEDEEYDIPNYNCFYDKIEDKIRSTEYFYDEISFDVFYLIENDKNNLLIKKSKHNKNHILELRYIYLDYGYFVSLYSFNENEIIDSVIIYQRYTEIEMLSNAERVYYIDDSLNIFTIDVFFDEEGIFCKAWNQHQLKMIK